MEGVHVERQSIQFALVVCHRGIGKAVELRKAAGISPDGGVICMKDVRTVPVYLDARSLFGIGIARDVPTSVDHKAAFAGFAQLLRHNCTIQPGANDQVVVRPYRIPSVLF